MNDNTSIILKYNRIVDKMKINNKSVKIKNSRTFTNDGQLVHVM